MDTKEINEAIHGVQIKEADLFRYLRLIAWGVIASGGLMKKDEPPEEWWPLITDPPIVKKTNKEIREEMREVFRKRDEAKKRK